MRTTQLFSVIVGGLHPCPFLVHADSDGSDNTENMPGFSKQILHASVISTKMSCNGSLKIERYFASLANLMQTVLSVNFDSSSQKF